MGGVRNFMPETTAYNSRALKDDVVTIGAISMVALMLATMLHEGLGHGALALLTGATSGTLSTVAWSSSFDSRLVAAGGTLVNLIAGCLFWLALRAVHNASAQPRFFLLISCAFNLFTGTGYFFFSGVTNFGDWQVAIAGMHPYWLWRTLLIVVGIAAYYCAMLIVGISLVRYLGVPVSDRARFRRLTWTPYFAAILIELIAGLRNPLGLPLVFESALPATAGANCALLFLRYYVPRSTKPGTNSQPILRSYAWIIVSAVLCLLFIFVVGPGIQVRR
jgi:hypothetical protein